MVLQGGEGPLGQGLAPQLIGQAVLGHAVAARHEQQLEHLLGLRAAEVPRAETRPPSATSMGPNSLASTVVDSPAGSAARMGQLSQPERNAVQGADLPENPVPERGGRPANPVTNATVIISQEPEARCRPLRPCPAPPAGTTVPGPLSRGLREVSRRSLADPDGRMAQALPWRSTRSGCSRNRPRLVVPREKVTAVRWENRNVREEVCK